MNYKLVNGHLADPALAGVVDSVLQQLDTHDLGIVLLGDEYTELVSRASSIQRITEENAVALGKMSTDYEKSLRRSQSEVDRLLKQVEDHHRVKKEYRASFEFERDRNKQLYDENRELRQELEAKSAVTPEIANEIADVISSIRPSKSCPVCHGKSGWFGLKVFMDEKTKLKTFEVQRCCGTAGDSEHERVMKVLRQNSEQLEKILVDTRGTRFKVSLMVKALEGTWKILQVVHDAQFVNIIKNLFNKKETADVQDAAGRQEAKASSEAAPAHAGE